jgi:hypothetical protein
MGSGPTPGAERRQNTQLRELFEQAYALIAPFYDVDQAWLGRPQTSLAYHTLRDQLPQLSAEEAHIIVVAVGRAWRERNPG